jgi:hypothetical protein
MKITKERYKELLESLDFTFIPEDRRHAYLEDQAGEKIVIIKEKCECGCHRHQSMSCKQCGDYTVKKCGNNDGFQTLSTTDKEEKEIKCLGCNDNGCPDCENIKWNIKE